MLHAYNNPVSVDDRDEGFTMVIGPRRDAQLIEIGVVRTDEFTFLVHALYPAQPKNIR